MGQAVGLSNVQARFKLVMIQHGYHWLWGNIVRNGCMLGKLKF